MAKAELDSWSEGGLDRDALGALVLATPRPNPRTTARELCVRTGVTLLLY